MGEPAEIADWLAGLTPPVSATDSPSEPDAVQEARRRVRSTVPPSYRWAFQKSLGDPATAARVAILEWVGKVEGWCASPWVILAGLAGSGKTSLGVAMLRAAFERAVANVADSYDVERAGRMRFVHAFRLGVARIQHRAGDGEAEEVRDAMRAPLILLDDVGSERDTANNALPDVIFERHAEGRATWMTTGLTVSQLKARYGDGIARRMLERATVIKVGETGESK